MVSDEWKLVFNYRKFLWHATRNLLTHFQKRWILKNVCNYNEALQESQLNLKKWLTSSFVKTSWRHSFTCCWRHRRRHASKQRAAISAARANIVISALDKRWEKERTKLRRRWQNCEQIRWKLKVRAQYNEYTDVKCRNCRARSSSFVICFNV